MVIGKNPYAGNISGAGGDTGRHVGNQNDLIGRVQNSLDTIMGSALTMDYNTFMGEIQNTSQFFNDLLNGNLNDDIATSATNTVLEDLGWRDSGYVTLNNMPVHVEPGSFIIQPKLNISETDMYMDGKDGESYTYMQWLNTTGVKINMTIYNKVTEKPQLGTEKDDDAATKEDMSLWDARSTVHRTLYTWSKTYEPISLWNALGLPYINGNYRIFELRQTMADQTTVKSEIELHSYTQDEMESTYYRNFTIEDLTGKDTSKTTALASRLEKVPETKKECSCQAPTLL